jgi:hypothetical protein
MGLDPLQGLVLEEMVFFLLINALVLGGLALLDDPLPVIRICSLLSRTCKKAMMVG